MSIIPTPTHPTWCDPRCCKQILYDDGSVGYEHRDAAPMLRPHAQVDAELTVRRTQLDDRGAVVHIGEVNVTLQVVDTATAGDGNRPLQTVVDLDPMDARMLAAQLVCAAEVVEATRLAGRGAA